MLQDRFRRKGCRPLVWRHRSGYTQAPPTGPHCTTGVLPEAPNPFLHRAEIVSRSARYHSYHSISHSPPHHPIPTHPFASSNPILLSAHAFLTPSIHLKGGLPLPLSTLISDIYTLLVNLYAYICSRFFFQCSTWHSLQIGIGLCMREDCCRENS